MGLFGLFGGEDSNEKKPEHKKSAESIEATGLIKFRYIPESSGRSGGTLARRPDDGGAAFLSSPQARVYPESQPPLGSAADKAVAILATPPEDSEATNIIGIGDIIVYNDGSRMEILEIGPDGSVTVQITKRWSAGVELDNKFQTEPDVPYSTDDYEFVGKGDEFYQNGQTAESGGIAFTVVQVERSGGKVQGVIFTFQQFFPEGLEGYAADIAHIVKK